MNFLRRHFAILTPRQWTVVCVLAFASIGLALGFALLFRHLNRMSENKPQPKTQQSSWSE